MLPQPDTVRTPVLTDPLAGVRSGGPEPKSGEGAASPKPERAVPGLWTVLRQDGLWLFFTKLWRRLTYGILRREKLIFFSNDVPLAPLDLPADITQSFSFVLVDAVNVGMYRRQLVEEFQLPARVVDRRIADGKQIMLALEGEKVVAMVWMAFRTQPVDEIGLKLRLLDGEFLTFDAVTLRPWRGRGLSQTLNRLADNHAIDLGMIRHLAWRSAGNAAALRVAERLGQQRIAVATSTWLFGRQVQRHVASLNRRGADTVSCLMDL
jgi:hypothetical protein